MKATLVEQGEWIPDNIRGYQESTLVKVNAALSSSCGTGWVSPEEHARVVNELEKAKDNWKYAQTSTDSFCHYRNMAIVLGAKPEHMLNQYDRDLCAKGIDKDDTSGGYHMSIQQIHDEQEALWAQADRARELEAQCAAMRGALSLADCCHGTGFKADGERIHMSGCRVVNALSSAAGRELLARLERAEARAKEAETLIRDVVEGDVDGDLWRNDAKAFLGGGG